MNGQTDGWTGGRIAAASEEKEALTQKQLQLMTIQNIRNRAGLPEKEEEEDEASIRLSICLSVCLGEVHYTHSKTVIPAGLACGAHVTSFSFWPLANVLRPCIHITHRHTVMTSCTAAAGINQPTQSRCSVTPQSTSPAAGCWH